MFRFKIPGQLVCLKNELIWILIQQWIPYSMFKDCHWCSCVCLSPHTPDVSSWCSWCLCPVTPRTVWVQPCFPTIWWRAAVLSSRSLELTISKGPFQLSLVVSGFFCVEFLSSSVAVVNKLILKTNIPADICLLMFMITAGVQHHVPVFFFFFKEFMWLHLQAAGRPRPISRCHSPVEEPLRWDSISSNWLQMVISPVPVVSSLLSLFKLK